MMNMAYIVNQKSKMALFTIFYSLFTLFAVPAFAAFEDTGTGARPTVMGGTYVAVGDDVQSLMYNPAGLAQLHTKEISSEYSRLYAGLTDGSQIGQYFMGYGQPIKYGGTLAFGWRQLSLDSLYTERTLALGYGEWITQNVAAGISLKQLHHSFEPPSMSVDDSGNVIGGSPSFFTQYGNASTAYSVDLGLLYRWTKRHTFGLSIQDVNEPNIALNPADHEIVPRTVRAGASYKGRRGLILAGSLTMRESLANQTDHTWTGAAEKWWDMKHGHAVGARGSMASGSRSFSQMAMGAGYRTSAFQIDYGFVFNLSGVALGNTMGTHRFSFSYRFGQPMKEKARVATAQKTTQKPVRKRPTPPPTAQELEDLEDTKPTTQTPVRAATPVEPELKQPAEDLAEGREIPETADMMNKTPAPYAQPSHAKVPGPGLKVQVPAPVPVEDLEEVSVQSEDVEVDVQDTEETPAPVEALTREELLAATGRMVGDYARKVQARESANARLSAFTPLYPALKGYALNRHELLEDLDESDALNRSEKVYESLKWEGASLQQRLGHLTGVLDSNLTAALPDRTWDMNDMRDRRYKAWLESALAKGRQMAVNGASAHTRMLYWGEVSRKALAFEKLPSEPIPPVRIEKEIRVEKTPKSAPLTEPTSKPSVADQKKAIGRALGDGEWLYKVKEGDTLLSLANQYYGDYNRWRDIYILNQDRLGRGGTLRAGQMLVMPSRKVR
jgi:nucleoid-associated protein YgaU